MAGGDGPAVEVVQAVAVDHLKVQMAHGPTAVAVVDTLAVVEALDRLQPLEAVVEVR